MVKRISGLAALLLCAVIAASCGKIKEIKPDELAALFNSNAGFAERLVKLDTVAAERRLSLNDKDYEALNVYIGTMAVCDEFAIIKTNNPEGVKDKLNNHIAQLRSEYEIYRPAEIYKLDNVYIDDYKGTVVMVVSSDKAKAEGIYKNYLKK